MTPYHMTASLFPLHLIVIKLLWWCDAVSKVLEQEYKIYNMLGVEISNGKVIDKDQINVSNFSSGTYVLQLENGRAFRFIKH